MSPPVPSPIELEVAVTRGPEMLVRAVFRPPALVSVGTNAMAVITSQDSAFPDYHELFRLHADGGLLLFVPEHEVELRLRDGVRKTAQILAEGLALPGSNAWRLPFGVGSKGAVRFGETAVLFKLRARVEVPLKAVRADAPTRCGTCGAAMTWALSGFGALTPCVACGTLNEVQAESQAPDLRRTEMAPRIRPAKSADLPTFDAMIANPARLPPKPALDRVSDLPTFDAISVLRPDAVAVRAEGEDQSAPTRRMPEFSPLAPGRAAQLSPVPARGAELPTFDAISVLQDQGLSTVGAMSALRGGEDAVPPLRLTDPGEFEDEQTAADDRSPAWESPSGEVSRPPIERFATDVPPPVHPTALTSVPLETRPEEPAFLVLATLSEGEQDFFRGDFSVDLAEQKSFVTLPRFSVPADADLSESAATEISFPVPGDAALRAAAPLPAPTVAAPVVPWAPAPTVASPVAPRAPAPTVASPVAPRAPAPTVASPVAPRAPAPTVASPVAPRAPAPSDLDESHDGDDFLMGRVDIPGGAPPTNRWLVLVGAVSGVVGIGLILYGLLG